MFILVHGKDSYRAKEKVKELLKDVKPEIFDFFDRQDFSFSLLKDTLTSGSLFDNRKAVVLRNVFFDAGFREEFLEKAGDLDKIDDLVIFFEARQVPAKENIVAFFKEKGEVFEFDFLKDSEIRTWAKKQASEIGCSLEPQALNFLIKAVGSDLWRLSAEIQKLAAYKAKDKKITKQDAELLVKQNIESHIFKTIEAIADKNKKAALELLYNHLEQGDHPSYLLAMIAYQFRTLLVIKDAKDSSVLRGRMNSFVISKNRRLAQKFTREQLDKIHSKIFKMDFAVKTGKIKPELALELLIADI